MKATPIAEFLARKGGESRPQPAPSNPFAARKVNVANDDDEPDFRRSGLAAALARRAPEGPPLVRPLDAASLPTRRETKPAPARALPPQPPEPPEDFEAKLEEAYHRGVQEGLDAGKAEASTARALERAEFQKRAVIEKLDFQMNEYGRLAEQLTQGLAEVERRVAESTAQLLKPLVMDSLAHQIVEELAENLARLTRAGGLNLVKVRGPERLIGDFGQRVASLAVEVEFSDEGGVEISVNAKTTELRSELEAWSRRIDEIVGNA